MVLCFLCAQALTSMFFGEDEGPLFAWFPKAYKVTAERLKRKLDKRITHAAASPELKSHL